MRRHGYEDVTIQHPRTSKNTTTLLNFPYMLPHIQSHSNVQVGSPYCYLIDRVKALKKLF